MSSAFKCGHLFLLQTLGKDAKKGVIDESWRNGTVEERLEYSLIKVIVAFHFSSFSLVVKPRRMKHHD